MIYDLNPIHLNIYTYLMPISNLHYYHVYSIFPRSNFPTYLYGRIVLRSNSITLSRLEKYKTSTQSKFALKPSAPPTNALPGRLTESSTSASSTYRASSSPFFSRRPSWDGRRQTDKRRRRRRTSPLLKFN